MRREKTNKSGCVLAGIIFLIIISLIACGTWYIKKEYKSKQEVVAEAFSELPVFDEVKTGKQIATEAGYPYPVPKPEMKPSEIAKKANDEATALTKKEYPASLFAKKQAEIFKKYRQAKHGEKVSFLLNTTRKTVRGVYKGTFKDHKGRFIKVDFHEYRLPDIVEDFQYLFVDGLAVKKATDKKKGLEAEFKNKKASFFTNKKEFLTEKYYQEFGYTKIDDTWVPNIEIFNAKLSDETESFETGLERDKEKIYQQNKLFGLFRIEFPEEDGLEEEESK